MNNVIDYMYKERKKKKQLIYIKVNSFAKDTSLFYMVLIYTWF